MRRADKRYINFLKQATEWKFAGDQVEYQVTAQRTPMTSKLIHDAEFQKDSRIGGPI